MYHGKVFLVSGGGKYSAGTYKWFNHGLSKRGSWATYITCYSFEHAFRQYKRTPYRKQMSQIDVRGKTIRNPYVIYAYRYRGYPK